MKFRRDFVTNSSSSCYLVAFDSDELHTIMAEAWADAYGMFDTTVGILIKDHNTLEDICSEYEFDKETREKAWSALNDGKLLVFKNVGYEDEGLMSFFHALSERDKGIVVILDR